MCVCSQSFLSLQDLSSLCSQSFICSDGNKSIEGCETLHVLKRVHIKAADRRPPLTPERSLYGPRRRLKTDRERGFIQSEQKQTASSEHQESQTSTCWSPFSLLEQHLLWTVLLHVLSV